MMRDTIRSEFRKVRTTRSALSLFVGLAALSALAIWGALAPASHAELATTLTKPNALFAIVIALPVFAAVLGIRSFTDEFRHGSIVPTYLVTPERRRVLAAKGVVAAAIAAVFALAAMAIGVGVAVVFLAAHGLPVAIDAGLIVAVTAKAVVLSALWGVIGVAIGAVVRHQVAAIVGLLLWMMVGEGLLSGAVPAVTRWLPEQSAVIGLGLDDGTVSLVAAVTCIAWVAGALALASRTVGRDVA